MNLPVDGSLRGRVALVTGAGRGIGRAAAVALAQAGANMALLARTPEQLSETAARVRECGVREVVAVTDVSDWDAVRDTVVNLERELGPVDVLINNAGIIGQFGFTWELDRAAFATTLRVNVLGPFHLIKAVVPGMVVRKHGVVINVSSGASRQASLARSAYSTSKAALDQMTRVLAAEATPFDVRVHGFYPGLVDTEMQAELRHGPGLPEHVREQFRARQRDGLLRSPTEPAAAIAWLASDAGIAWPDVLVDWSGDRQQFEERAGVST